MTERARQAVVLSSDEARSLRHTYIGTEHLLLGLLREEHGLAARALENFGILVEDVRGKIIKRVGIGENPVTDGQIPFTPRAKKVLELALREALSLGHNYIGTEHILLGIVREDAGMAVMILHEYGADAEHIRSEVIRLLSRPRLESNVLIPDKTAEPIQPTYYETGELLLAQIRRLLRNNQWDSALTVARAYSQISQAHQK